MTIQIIDLTDYKMPCFEGYESHNLSDIKRVFNKIPRNIRKDIKPIWWYDSVSYNGEIIKWKQTWSIRKKFIEDEEEEETDQKPWSKY